jgi:hypothetical protein
VDRAARLVARRGPNVAAVALANHNARVLWALLSRGDGYRPPISSFPSRPSAGAVIKRAREGKLLVFSSLKTLGHRPIDHLIETELLVPKAEARNAGDLDRVATVAAVLLFGKEKIVRRELPTAETVLALETSINTPLTASKWLNIIDSVRSYSTWIRDNLPGPPEPASPFIWSV